MLTPDSVRDKGSYALTNDIRGAIKQAAELTDGLRKQLAGRDNGEATANATIAYRSLEDASMRLGKVLQALDGGVSVYDRATTVGVATTHDDAPTASEIEDLKASQTDQPKGPTSTDELAPIGG